MKLATQTFLFSALWLILCGCPPGNPRNDMEQLRKDRYDFKQLKARDYAGITFDCPQMLRYTYMKDYLLKKNGLSLNNWDLGVFLSVEKFTQAEAEKQTFYFEEEVSTLDAIHEHYVDERIHSLKYYENSIKTVLPEGSKLNGSMEVIYGRGDDYGEDLRYMIATVEKDSSCYVFQFIAGEQMAAYLFDDFKHIITSAH